MCVCVCVCLTCVCTVYECVYECVSVHTHSCVCRPQYSLSLKECESLQSQVKELQLQLATNQEEAETMRGGV